jgi:CshA-type fibril repeat protein
MIRKLTATLAAIGIALFGFSLPSQAASSPVLVTQVLNYNSVDYAAPIGSPLEIPGGASLTLVVGFDCNTVTSVQCVDPEVVVTLPTGVTVGQISYSASYISAMTGSGTTRTFDFNTLSPGTSGQITIPLTVNEWVHLDNLSLSASASASTEAGASNANNANTVYMKVRSGTTNRATTGLNSGGALDSTTQYVVNACLDRITGFGGLGVQAGAQLVTTLPLGAVFVSASDVNAVYNSNDRTVTLTTTAPKNDAFCGGYTVDVTYPSGGTNTAGASKTLAFSWIGRKLGEVSDSTLATSSYNHLLTAPALGGSVSKGVNGTRMVGSTPSAATGDPISYALALANNNTQDWDTATLTDEIPDGIKVTGISITNRGRGTAPFAVKTNFGADGISGNADDNALIPIHTLSAPPVGTPTTGTTFANLYSSNFGSLGRPLASGEFVTFVSLVTSDVAPGVGGYVVTISAEVRSTYNNNSLVQLGNTITNNVDLEITTGATTITRNASANLIIDSPMPTVTVRNGAGVGSLGPGVRTDHAVLSASTASYKLPNPRFIAILPKFVSLTAWSSTDNSLPTATMTQTPNFDGQGRTKVLFSWPNGTELAQGQDWSVRLDLNFDYGSYGTLRVGGFVSSASIPSNCGDPWFLIGADVLDYDQDSDVSEVLCAWGADFTLATDASTRLTSYVKGSWDSAYTAAPAIGYTTPNSSDSVKAELLNTGTVSMTNVVVVNKLSRPGDSTTISATNRNPISGTFPVTLRTRPVVPTNLTDSSNNPVAVTTYYSTQTNPCLTEMNYSAAGCATAVWSDWDTTAPTTISDVTFLKFDFGAAHMIPGDLWAITMGISTPSSGAGESEFAVVNPTTNSANDEKAYVSFASRTTRVDLNSRLGASESTAVALQMPSVYGPPIAPIVSPQTASGTQGTPVTHTITPPVGGTVKLWDGTAAVTTLTIAGEGTYTIVPATGVVTFTPLPNFSGQGTAIAYQAENIHNLTANSTYAVNLTATPAQPQTPAPSVVLPPVPTVPSVPAPLPPSVPVTPSQGVSVVNNIAVPVPVAPNVQTNTVSVVQPTWELNLRSLTATGSTARLDQSGRVIATTGLRLRSTGSGFAPNTQVNLFLVGTSTPIATLTTDASGNFSINVPIPAGLPAGTNHFQVAGITTDNLVRTTSIEVIVQKLRLEAKVLFRGDSAVLTAEAKRILAGLARRLQGVYGSIAITATGFVNKTSDTSYDTRLSRARARNAANYLKSLGIEATVVTKVFGIAPEKGQPARRAELTATVN